MLQRLLMLALHLLNLLFHLVNVLLSSVQIEFEVVLNLVQLIVVSKKTLNDIK